MIEPDTDTKTKNNFSIILIAKIKLIYIILPVINIHIKDPHDVV